MLSKTQRRRYHRHLILSEIGAPGQAKILNSRVLIIGKSARECESLLYYLVASGVGSICCWLEHWEGFFELVERLKDLNPDVLIKKIHGTDFHEVKTEIDSTPLIRIIIGNTNFILKYQKDYWSGVNIVALFKPWAGMVQGAKGKNPDIDSFGSYDNREFPIGNLLAQCFIGALVACMVIKICLTNTIIEEPIYFDLLNMDFSRIPSHSLKESYYRLAKSKVLIVGAGGLGSPVAYALALAGVDTIGIVDSDIVEMSNLNRQILHTTSRIGEPKVDSAYIFLQQVNPNIKVIPHYLYLTQENTMNILENFDLVIAAVDNIPTRYLINDMSHIMKKPYIEAGIQGFYGMATSFIDENGPCYRCIFPEDNKMPMPPSSQTGILGPVPGVLGYIEAAEAIKTIMGIGHTLQNRLVIFDATDMTFKLARYKKASDCITCKDGLQKSLYDI